MNSAKHRRRGKKKKKKLWGLVEVRLLLHLEAIRNKTQSRCLATLNPTLNTK